MSGNAYKDLEKQQEDTVVALGRDAPAKSSSSGGDEAKESQEGDGMPGQSRNVMYGIAFCLIVWMIWLSSMQPECSPAHKKLLASVNGTAPINLQSPEGMALLRHPDTISHPFFEGGLSLHFTSQITNVYCGVASMTVVFNALGLPFEGRPQSPLMKPGGYRYFDQNNVFNGCMRDVMHEAGIYQSPWGITLKQLKEYFGCRTNSDYRGGDDFQGGARELSRVLAREMSTPGHFLVANYHRRAIGQTGGGHHSPLGAYSPSKDMVLIMDVARYRYGPVWFPVKDLYAAIDTTDNCGVWTQNETKAGEPLQPYDPVGTSVYALFTGEVCTEVDKEKMRTRFQFPVCEPAQRGIVLACAPGSAKCKL